MKAEPQSCCLEYMYTLSISDHRYLISKASDENVAFLFWQATESRNFLGQALQYVFQ